MASRSITVLNGGPLKVSRAETSGKAMAFLSGGPVRVETLKPAGAIRLAGTPGPSGRDGIDGEDGDQGPPGPPVDTSTLALDGGNF